MLQSGPKKESVDGKRDRQEFDERDSPSWAEKFESFVEDFIAYEDDEDDRKDDVSVREDVHIDEVESENIVESEYEQ